MELVSIIMTAYNAEDTISRAIEGILAQTYTNFELIIINDCSTDSTLEILKTYKKAISRIRVITTSKNYGTFVCKNYGMMVAKGDYFTFHDSDDYCMPEYIEKSYYQLQNSGLPVSYTGCTTIFDASVKQYRWNKSRGSYNEISTHSAFFSRKVFEEIGYFDSVRFGADNELRRRFKAYYGQIAENKRIKTYIYEKRDGSLTCNEVTGFKDAQKNRAREVYKRNYLEWHKTFKKGKSQYLPFPLEKRPFRITVIHKTGYVALSTFKELGSNGRIRRK